MSGTTSSPTPTIHRASVVREHSTPMRCNCRCWRYSGSASAYFAVAMKLSSPGLAKLFGNGCAGIDAVRRYPLAARAAVLGADVAQHPHLRRDDVELLAHHLAEALELDGVMRAGALRLRQPMHDVDARQIRRQRRALGASASVSRDLGVRRAFRFLVLLSARLGLVEQPQLPVGHLLRRGGEALGKEQPHLLLQVFDQRVAFGDDGVALGEFGFVATHLRVQRGEVFVSGGRGGRAHDR